MARDVLEDGEHNREVFMFVLVIDDDRAISRLVVDVLRAKGFDADSATNVEQAALAVQGRHPDLILLDVKLRAGSGIDALRFLRDSFDLESVPVVLVSAMPAGRLRELAHANDCAGILCKPFGLAELVECARHWTSTGLVAQRSF